MPVSALEGGSPGQLVVSQGLAHVELALFWVHTSLLRYREFKVSILKLATIGKMMSNILMRVLYTFMRSRLLSWACEHLSSIPHLISVGNGFQSSCKLERLDRCLSPAVCQYDTCKDMPGYELFKDTPTTLFKQVFRNFEKPAKVALKINDSNASPTG